MNLDALVENLVTQAPLAGVGVYVAKLYMEKHEAAIQKLLATFEGEVRACEVRYQMVFDELMKLKDKLGG
jgi:hypothetical protein